MSKHKSQKDPDLIYKSLFNQMPGYIYWKNKDSIYQACNWNLASLSKLNSPSDIKGKRDMDFSWGQGLGMSFVSVDQYVLETGNHSIEENQIPIRKEDGSWMVVRTEKMPFYNEQGSIIGVIGMSVDVTDKNNEIKFALNKKKTAELAESLSTSLLDTTLHELSSPIAQLHEVTSNILVLNLPIDEKHKILSQLNNINHDMQKIVDRTFSYRNHLNVDSTKINQAIDIKKLISDALEKSDASLRLRLGSSTNQVILNKPDILKKLIQHLTMNQAHKNQHSPADIHITFKGSNLVIVCRKFSKSQATINEKVHLHEKLNRATIHYLTNKLDGILEEAEEKPHNKLITIYIPIELTKSTAHDTKQKTSAPSQNENQFSFEPLDDVS